MHAFVAADSSLVCDLAELVARAPLPAPGGAPATLRTQALRCLSALSRARVPAVLTQLASHQHRRVLPELLHHTVAALLHDCGPAQLLGAAADGPPLPTLAPGAPRLDSCFAEAVFSLLGALAGNVVECGLSDSAVVAALLPLLRDAEPRHAPLLATSLRLLEAFMEFQSAAGGLLRDGGGLALLVQRLRREVDPTGDWGAPPHNLQPLPPQEEEMTEAEQRSEVEQRAVETVLPVLDAPHDQPAVLPVPVPSTEPAPPVDAPVRPIEPADAPAASHASRSVVKALMRCIGLAALTPRAGGAQSTAQLLEPTQLPPCLVAIYRQPRALGGSVFALAMNLLADIIHSAPTAYPQLHLAGAPTALLSALQSGGVPASSDAIVSLPTVLGAVCLNAAGLAQVVPSAEAGPGAMGALAPLLPVLTSKAFAKPMSSGDTAGMLAAGLDELLRHVPQLRPAGIALLLAALRQLARAAGGAVGEEGGAAEHMETDAPAPQTGPPEAWVPDTLCSLARVLEGVLANAEACRLFVEGDGIVSLLAAISAPAVTRQATPGGTWHHAPSASANLSGVVRVFGAQHAPQLAKALRSWLTGMLGALLHLGHELPDECTQPLALPEPYVGALAATEALLTLAATALRALPALLPSFLEAEGGEGSQDALGTLVAQAERTTAWQAALAEEARREWLAQHLEPQALRLAAQTAAEGAAALMAAAGVDPEAPSAHVHAAMAVALASLQEKMTAARAAQPGSVTASTPPFSSSPEEMCNATAEVMASVLLPCAEGAEATPQLEQARASVARTLAPVMQRAATAAAAVATAAESAAALGRFRAAARGFLLSLSKAISGSGGRRGEAPGPARRAAVWSLAQGLVGNLTAHPEQRLPHGGALRVRPGDQAPPARLLSLARLRYLFTVLDGCGSLLFDPRRRSANAMLLNYALAQGGAGAIGAVVSEVGAAFVGELAQRGCDATTPAPLAPPLPPALDEALYCGGVMLEVLCNAPWLLTAPSSAELLALPPPRGEHTQPGVATAAGGSLDVLFSGVHACALAALMPLWQQPLLRLAPPRFLTALLAALGHVARGPPHQSAAAQPQSAAAVVAAAAAEQRTVRAMAMAARVAEMGFPLARCEEAARRLRHQASVESIMEWLIMHPEGEAEAAAREAADAQAQAHRDQQAEAAGEEPTDEDLLAAMAMSMGARDAGSDAQPQAAPVCEPPAQLCVPPPQELLAGCAQLVAAHPAAAHSAVDLLAATCRREGGLLLAPLLVSLVARLRDLSADDAAGGERGESAGGAIAVHAHLALLLLNEEPPARTHAADQGLPGVLLALLERAAPPGAQGGAQRLRPWTAAALLTLDVLAQWRPAADAADEAPAPEAPADAPAPAVADEADARLNRALGRLTGHLSPDEQTRATAACVALLRSAAAAAAAPSASLPVVGDDTPASVCQAAMTLASRLTKRHAHAAAFHALGGTVALLALPPFALFPGFEALAAALLRHVLEDGATLRAAMEAELRGAFVNPQLLRPGGRVSPRTLLTHLAPVIGRDPAAFCDALATVTAVDESSGRTMLVLGAAQPQTAAVVPGDGAAAAPGLASPAPARKAAHKAAPAFVAVLDALVALVTACPPAASSEGMDVDSPQPQPSVADLAAGRAAFALHLLTDFLLMYGATAGVLLRRDSEAAAAGALRPLLSHVLHALMPKREGEEGGDGKAAARVSDRAVVFLLALCVRSSEGRRRVLAAVALSLASAAPTPGCAAPPGALALVDLVNSLLARRSGSAPTGAQPPGAGISADMARAMRDAQMVRALTAALASVDLDHPAASGAVSAVLRPLETLTRMHAAVVVPPAAPSNAVPPGAAAPSLGADLGTADMSSPPPAPRRRVAGETVTPARHTPAVAATPATAGPAPLEEQVAAVSEMAALLFQNESRRRRRHGGAPRRASSQQLSLEEAALAAQREGLLAAHGSDAEMHDGGSSDSGEDLVDGSDDDDQLMAEEEDEEDEEGASSDSDSLADHHAAHGGPQADHMQEDEDEDDDDEELSEDEAELRRRIRRDFARATGGGDDEELDSDAEGDGGASAEEEEDLRQLHELHGVGGEGVVELMAHDASDDDGEEVEEGGEGGWDEESDEEGDEEEPVAEGEEEAAEEEEEEDQPGGHRRAAARRAGRAMAEGEDEDAAEEWLLDGDDGGGGGAGFNSFQRMMSQMLGGAAAAGREQGDAIEIRWRDASGRTGATAAMVPPQLRVGQPGGMSLHELQSMLQQGARGGAAPGTAAFAHIFSEILDSAHASSRRLQRRFNDIFGGGGDGGGSFLRPDEVASAAAPSQRHPLLQRGAVARSAAPAAAPATAGSGSLASVLACVTGDLARLAAAPDMDSMDLLAAFNLDGGAEGAPPPLPTLTEGDAVTLAAGPPARAEADLLAPLFGSPATDALAGAMPSGALLGAGMMSRLLRGPEAGVAAPGGVADPRRAVWGDEAAALGGGSPAMLVIGALEAEAVARVRAAHPPPPPPPAPEPAPQQTTEPEAMAAAEAPPTLMPEPGPEPAPPAADVVMDEPLPAAPPPEAAAADAPPPEPPALEPEGDSDGGLASDSDGGSGSDSDSDGGGEAAGEPAADAPPPEQPIPEIDPSFLEALPAELRAEVMMQQAVAAAQLAAERAAAQRAQERAQAAGPAPGEGAAAGIDPEFLAALPPEIAAEVLAQQAAAARAAQAREARTAAAAAAAEAGAGAEAAADGGAADAAAEFVAMLASFPPDVREEVLITADDALLASLPEALRAEARALRERAMRRFGGLFVGSAQRADAMLHARPGGRVSSRALAGQPPRRLAVPGVMPRAAEQRRAGALLLPFRDVEGEALLDDSALSQLLRLLRLAPPLSRGLLPRLLLHLCAHAGMRRSILARTLSLARDDQPATDPAQRRMFGTTLSLASECVGEEGHTPALVVRRALETCVYLSRHHSRVAQLLPQLPVPPAEGSVAAASAAKGKAKVGASRAEDVNALALLLALLAQPATAQRHEHLLPALQLLESVLKACAPLPEHSAEAMAEAQAAAQDASRAATLERTHLLLRQFTDTAPGERMPPEPAAEPPAPLAAVAADAPPLAAEAAKADEQTAAALAEEEAARAAARAAIAALPDSSLLSLTALLTAEEVSESGASRAAAVLGLLPVVHPECAPVLRAALAEQAAATCAACIAALGCLCGGVAPGAVLPPGAQSLLFQGPALLRVVHAAMALHPSASAPGAPTPTPEAPAELRVAMTPLWVALEESAGALEAMVTPEVLQAAATVSGEPPAALPDAMAAAQPLLEAWFMLTEGDGEAAPPASLAGTASASASQQLPSRAPSPAVWAMAAASEGGAAGAVAPSPASAALWRFSERHRRLLNALVRAQPSLLEGTFRRLLHAPRLLDFDNKRALLRSRLRALAQSERAPPVRLAVRRPHVLTDSYQQLHMRHAAELRGRLSVQFQGEEGVDAGGLTREWFSILARAMFDPSFALFVPSAGGDAVFQPNKDSAINPEHLSYFTFCGRVVGKALHDGQLLDAYFTRSFYKHILRAPVSYEDVEALDPDYYSALKWMLEHDITGVLDLTFVAEEDYFGARTIVELREGGAQLAVTEENKRDYVQLITAHRMTGAIKEQTEAFTRGFHDLVPHELVHTFNAAELELLISGLPEIDVDDLVAHTEYNGFTPSSPAITWFWTVVRAMSREDLARLVMFVTGSSKVPLGGFAALQGISGPQKFQIHRAYGGGGRRLCTAHTCFNQLDLPEYGSLEELKERLALAIHEGNEGFGFA